VTERVEKSAVYLIYFSLVVEIRQNEIVNSIVSKKSKSKSIMGWNETAISQSVDHNRHEDAVLQSVARNARTISGQQACQASNRIQLVNHRSSGNDSMWVLTCSNPHERRIVGTGTQRRDIIRNMPGCVTY